MKRVREGVIDCGGVVWKRTGCVDWRETLEWRSAENHPRIIQHIKRLALKFCSQQFHSLDLRLYCWVAEDNSTLCAYSAVFCCRLSSRTSDAWYTCLSKRWWKSKLASFQGADESQNAAKYFLLFTCNDYLQSPICRYGVKTSSWIKAAAKELEDMRVLWQEVTHSEPNISK